MMELIKGWGEVDSSFDFCKENYEMKFGTVFDEIDNHVTSIIYYGRPYFMIVSSSYNEKVFFFDSKTGKILKILGYHRNLVNKVVKFSEEKFLSCSSDNLVIGYSIRKMDLEKRFTFSSSTVVNILKLNNDHFLMACYDNDIFVISYSKNELVRRLEEKKCNYTTRLKLSQKHDSCFYIGEKDPFQTVHLINYETNSIILSLTDHPHVRVKGINVFNEQKAGEEILIVSLSECSNEDEEWRHSFWFYNTSEIPVKSKVVNFVYDGCMNSVGFFKNRYICTGDNGKGFIHLYDVQELFYKSNSSKALIIKKKVLEGNNGIHSFCFKYSKNKKKVELLFCGHMFVKSVFLFGLDCDSVMEELSQKDEKERIDFLHTEIEDYSFQDKEIERIMFVKLNLYNICIENVLRVCLIFD